ncbi:VanZ family protein [Gracilibacillus oryzae]|uniref:VanZ family protein n=1 Tax=Gracilibacillus oryzae TaxID=1672701 RepID=A0A7C8KT35_9BACI|nr:VanZ family protein [Gracilibacillus oryzae]KAB8138099.1 VanZ family protein [Gracilibacillus oryzae]
MKSIKTLLFLVLAAYILIITDLILFKYTSLETFVQRFHLDFQDNLFHWQSHNFIPLNTISYYLFQSELSFSIRFRNLFGNFAGFIPFGFLFPLIFIKFQSLKNIMFATFCLSLLFELVQLVFGLGTFDVDDLILNTLGGVFGYFLLFLYLLFKKSIKKSTLRKGGG